MTITFAAAQDDKKQILPPGLSVLGKNNLPSRRNPPLSEILQKYDKMLYVYSERRR